MSLHDQYYKAGAGNDGMTYSAESGAGTVILPETAQQPTAGTMGGTASKRARGVRVRLTKQIRPFASSWWMTKRSCATSSPKR